jgi:hypothetical protein
VTCLSVIFCLKQDTKLHCCNKQSKNVVYGNNQQLYRAKRGEKDEVSYLTSLKITLITEKNLCSQTHRKEVKTFGEKERSGGASEL